MKNMKQLSDGELQVMQIVWHNEPPVSRMVVEKKLKQTHKPAATTILTFLARLCDKGFLSVEKRERINFYTPLISEREYLAEESRNMLDKLYGGSVKAFAASLCDSRISRKEIDELYEMLQKGEL